MLSNYLSALTLPFRWVAFKRNFLPQVPEAFKEAVSFAFRPHLLRSRLFPRDEKRLAEEVENFRQSIPRKYPDVLSSYASPHSGSFTLSDENRAEPGSVSESSVSAHAQTGIGPFGGILLKRIAEGVKAARMLELGTNTGFSARYLLSSETQPELVTIEGSADLCNIAQDNLNPFSGRCEIKNALFDDAIDHMISEGEEKFDLVFIDGQHEKEATLHYAHRVRPLMKGDGVYIFDDIYWSEDMHAAWNTICGMSHFGLTMDLGRMGIAVLAADDSEEAPQHLDLCQYRGRPEIVRKGW